MLTASSPFSFILFGASGNLAKLKLYPALYTLALKKRLPEQYAVVGYARTAMTDDEFRKLVADSVNEAMLGEANKKVLQEFLTHVFYVQGQYDAQSDFERLHERLHVIEKNWSSRVRLAYLSTPPNVIAPVVQNLCSSGITRHEGDFRCIVEKPVGHDGPSAEAVMQQLLDCLKPEEIYLLDHYLGKEAVRNVYYMRLANPILEHLCSNTLIQHVEITGMESVGIEERAGYFESAGTFRDFVQSHLLEMMSLLTMNLNDREEALMGNRLEALQSIMLPKGQKLEEIILQGQYDEGAINGKTVRGYLDEEGVAKGSRVNTYVALKLMSTMERWKNVPFYLRTGKRLSKKETRISLQFFEPRSKEMGKNTSPNRLDIIMQGEAGMRFVLQTKVGGTEPTFRPLVMEDPLVCVGDCLPEHGLLLLEAIHGRKNWYLDFEEVRNAWKLADPLQAYLADPKTPLHCYPAGSEGPEASKRWMEKEGVSWFN